MKKMAKVAAMLAALALLFGAIGCSSDGGDDSSPPPPIYGDEDNEQDSENIEYDHSIWDIEYGCVKKYKGRESSAEIPDGVKDIGGYVFKDCVTITEVTIPKSVSYIAGNAFKDCDGLISVRYLGTKEEWKNIEKELGQIGLTNPSALVWCYNADTGIFEKFYDSFEF